MLGETKAGTESFGSQSFNSPGNTDKIIMTKKKLTRIPEDPEDVEQDY